MLDSGWRWFKATIVAGVVYLIVVFGLGSVLPPELILVDIAVGLTAAALASGRYARATGCRDWVGVAVVTIAVFLFLAWVWGELLAGHAFPSY